MGPLWLEAFRYHQWANGILLGVCSGLTEEQLQLTTPGTYGSIADTFQHLVAAQHRYVRQLGGPLPQLAETDPFPGIAQLKEQLVASDVELLAIAERITPEDQFERPFRGGQYRLDSGVVIIQALHHGNDHRTHICTVLGANGIEYRDMDVWAYGDAIGAIVPV